MQSSQNGLGRNLVINRNVVSAGLDLLISGPSTGNARSQARMRSSPVVMCDPFLENAAQVPLAKRNQEVQAFAADCSYQWLTESVCLGSPEWRLQYPQLHPLQGGIEIGRVNAVAIMNEKVLRLFAGNHLSELLKCPGGRGMIGHVEVSNPSGSYLHDHKDIEDSKVGGHDDEEIAGQDRLGVISHECHPPLRRGALTRSYIERHVASNRPRGKTDAEFQQEFGGYALFAPSRIAPGHFRDQLSHVRRNTEPAAWLRLPTPEQLKAFAMPVD